MQQVNDDKLFERMVEVQARHWGIPKKYRQRPVVRDHVRFCHQLRQLQQEIDMRALEHHPDCSRSHHHDTWMSDEELFSDNPSLWQKMKYAVLHKGRFPAPILKPKLTDRYRCVELLLRCVIEVLEQGLNGDEIDNGYLKSKLGRAVSFYGLDVVDSEQVG